MNTFDNLSIKINKLFEYKNYKKKSISKGFVFKFLSRYLIGLLILTKVSLLVNFSNRIPVFTKTLANI